MLSSCSAVSPALIISACYCSRKRTPKVKAPAADAFAAPQPSAPSQLTFPEFEYVLRARTALEQAQLRGSRNRGEHLWRNGQGNAEQQQLSAFQPEDGEQALPEEAEYEGGHFSQDFWGPPGVPACCRRACCVSCTALPCYSLGRETAIVSE